MSSGSWVLAVLPCLCACGSNDPDRPPPADAGGLDDAGMNDAAADTDAGRPAWDCVCEGEEHCADCLANIGTCCYDDARISAQINRLVGTCARTGACSACCNECAAKSCEELLAAGACPAIAEAPWDNGIVLANGVYQELAASPLTTEGLEGQESLASLLSNPGFLRFLSYVIECALPEEAGVEIGGETFAGAYGLAPEWAEGPCGTACQEWVTACMLARYNTYGVTVTLYARSTHPAMQAPEADEANYPEQEGAFYGNMFLDSPVQYSCRGEGRDPLLGTFRVCTQPGNRCGMQYVGSCGPVDGETAEPSSRHACEEYDPARRAYSRCHNRATEEGSDAFPSGTQVYERVMTTWVARSAFHEGYGAACEGEPIPPPVPSDTPGGAGAPCDNDDDCATERGLHCDARPMRGICTMVCTNSPDPSAEEDQCGEGGTCLADNPLDATCTAACTPHSRGGDCPDGQLCSSSWSRLPAPDDPGCRPFCSTDADCPPQAPCNRFGACGIVVDPEALADGEPCTLPDGGDCRGACIPIDADPSHGLCGSLINLAVTEDCPDDPRMDPVTGDDDLGVCVYRRCDVDEDCTSPLVCTDAPRGRLCDYPR